MKTKPRTIYTWSDDLAYAVGLIASDGCLQRVGRVVQTFPGMDVGLPPANRSGRRWNDLYLVRRIQGAD